jgi:hypothetical protein
MILQCVYTDLDPCQKVLSRGLTYPFFEDIISYPYPGPPKGYWPMSCERDFFTLKGEKFTFSNNL